MQKITDFLNRKPCKVLMILELLQAVNLLNTNIIKGPDGQMYDEEFYTKHNFLADLL